MNSIIDGSLVGSYGIGASVALLSIVMVFLILLVIIVICDFAGKMIEKVSKDETVIEEKPVTRKVVNALDLNDEDATVACLIASIDMRNEIKKNVKVVSVRRIA